MTSSPGLRKGRQASRRDRAIGIVLTLALFGAFQALGPDDKGSLKDSLLPRGGVADALPPDQKKVKPQHPLGKLPLAIGTSKLATTTSTTSTTAPATTTTTTPVTTTTTSVVTAATSGSLASPPPSIAADCSRDVSGELNQWIASVPDGSTLLFGPSACYRIEKRVVVRDRHDLLFEGNGSTFRAMTLGTGTFADLQARDHFRIIGGSRITFRNFSIRGVNTDHRFHTEYAFQHGFRLIGVADVTIEHVHISEVYGDWVAIFGDLHRTWTWSERVTIRNNTFEWAGRQGVSLMSAEDVTIADNTMLGVGQTAIDIEPDTGTDRPTPDGSYRGGGVKNIVIARNKVSGPVVGAFVSAHGHTGAIAELVTIDANELTKMRLWIRVVGEQAVHRTGWRITNNSSNIGGSSVYGGELDFVYADDIIVSGNRTGQAWYPSRPIFVGARSVNGLVVRNNNAIGYHPIVATDYSMTYQGRTSEWSGPKSTGVFECGNTYGDPAAPTVATPKCPS